jgi:hypothetical protein
MPVYPGYSHAPGGEHFIGWFAISGCNLTLKVPSAFQPIRCHWSTNA